MEQPTSEGSTAQEKAVDNGEAETAKPQQEEDIQTKEAEEQKPLAEDAVEVSEKVQPTEAEIAQPAEVPVVPEKEATPTPAAEQSAAVPITPTSKGLFVLPKAPTLKKYVLRNVCFHHLSLSKSTSSGCSPRSLRKIKLVPPLRAS